jgi:uncharacterized protein YjbI with pentapeptide repeats
VKRKILHLTLYSLLVFFGWVGGYLRIPFVERNQMFLFGFLACVGLLGLIGVALKIWNYNISFVKWLGLKNEISDNKKAKKIYVIMWVSITSFIAIGAITSAVVMLRQNRIIVDQTERQDRRFGELTEITQSIRQNNQVNLMSNVLNQVEEELNSNPPRKLSDPVIARIAALSFSFKPYRYFENDTLSENELSPERGQLLVALALMNIDSTSFDKIKKSTTFAKSDLRGVNLERVNLSGINLEDADLSYAELSGINISEGRMRRAKFVGVSAQNSNLSNSDLRSAVMTWSEFSHSNMSRIDFSGADLSNSQLMSTNLSSSIFNFTMLIGSSLIKSDLSNSDLERSNLSNADLTQANLLNGNLVTATIFGLNLNQTVLEGVEIQTDWIDNLPSKKIIALDEVLNKYLIIDSLSPNGVVKYYLKKKL